MPWFSRFPGRLAAFLPAMGLLLLPNPAAARPVSDSPAPTLVLSFDDLPQHGSLPEGVTAEQVVRSITGTLRGKGVPAAYGYVNGAQLAQAPDLAKVLQIWKSAGYTLGNHGWAHKGLDSLTPAQFADEVQRNEPLLVGQPRTFRFPFLAEGRDPALRDAARLALLRGGYAIAPVSMDFSDWAYNAAYARCVARKDDAAIARLEKALLADAASAARYARANAVQLTGAEIPQVLLLHAGAFTARMLPQLLDLYRGMGFRYTTLEKALADPVYAASRNPALPFETGNVGARAGALPKPPGAKIDGFCN